MKRWLALAALALVASPFMFTYKNRSLASKPELKAGASAVGLRDRRVVDGQITGGCGVQGRGQVFGFCAEFAAA
jgi:hypothetical protein